MSLTIRAATPTDLPAIMEIYNQAGVGTTASYDLEPVTIQERTNWFERTGRAGGVVLVGDEGGAVVGYASYGPFRDKAGYSHTVEHSVYVLDGKRSSGIGRMLMAALMDYARGQGIHVMVGVLDADNEASRAFHARLGFVESAVLPQVGRKFGRWLDVVFVTHQFS